MARVTPRGPGASAAETEITASSVERPRRAPDDGALEPAAAAAVEPSESAPASSPSAPDEDFTVVVSKKERRRQRKESAATQEVFKNVHPPSVELPRCAPDAGARTREPPQEPHVPTASTTDAKDQDRRNDAARQGEDRNPDVDPVGTFAEWRLAAVGESLSTSYQAIRWLESVRGLHFGVRVSPSGEFCVRAKTMETACELSAIASENTEGIVLEKSGKEVRGVVLGYPVHLPLDAIVEHPNVRTAERCFYSAGRGRRLPTRSVQVTEWGTLPSSLDLGCWGRFACRRYVPEPIRCFRCQAFGHHQRHCRRPADLCGWCCGEHQTRVCIRRLREGEDAPSPKCPNCGAAHGAWHRRCPARLRRIPGAAPPRGTSVRPPRPQQTAAVDSESRGSGRPARKRRRRNHSRRTARGRTLGERPLPTSAPPTGEDGDPRRPGKGGGRTPAPPRVEALGTVIPSTPSAANRSKTSASSRGRAPSEVMDKSRHGTKETQTRRCFALSEEALTELLVQFEHLLAQEREARTSFIAHEPALHCARRHVREGRRIPDALPMDQPLKNPPRYRYHRGEKSWVQYKEEAKAKTLNGGEEEEVEDRSYAAPDPEEEDSAASTSSTTNEDSDAPNSDEEFESFVEAVFGRR